MSTVLPPAQPGARARPRAFSRPLLYWTLGALALVLAWDAIGLDRTLAHWFGSSTGFALRDDWFFVHVLHEDARRLGWLLVLALCLGVWWPMGPLRRITRGERLQLAVGTLLALGVVMLVKSGSSTSCPWDLVEFGGAAHYVPHWTLGVRDGGGGRCFPAGHASAGFSFLAGYFAFRRRAPGVARAWLACALAAGFGLGLAQQARGAHFMSHTLWTGWLCWTTGWVCDLVGERLRRRRAA